MPAASKTLAIMITPGKSGLSAKEARLLAESVTRIVAESGHTAVVRECSAGEELYVAGRPNKRERLQAIETMSRSMTPAQIAKALGLSERQVWRYRAFLAAFDK